MSPTRNGVFFNAFPAQTPIPATTSRTTDPHIIRAFHRRLPGYAPTPLVALPSVAADLGVRAVLVKDEGSGRLNLPAFKILGASWGAFRAIADKFGIPAPSSPDDVAARLEDVRRAAQEHDVTLYAATDGNHGRAVAAFARLLGIKARIYVPAAVNPADVELIRSEDPEVIVCEGMDYDQTMRRAWGESRAAADGILVQDCAFEGYEVIPAWIVEGYLTMLAEIDEQLPSILHDGNELGTAPRVVITPVGVGSLAHAVVTHYKSTSGSEAAVGIVSVEPETAACLSRSLEAGHPVSVDTSGTIMDGLNCGTVSSSAWGALQVGIDAAATVSDAEAHAAVEYLAKEGVQSGPCGAATLAALRKLAAVDSDMTTSDGAVRQKGLLSKETVVILLNTEGRRKYTTPL